MANKLGSKSVIFFKRKQLWKWSSSNWNIFNKFILFWALKPFIVSIRISVIPHIFFFFCGKFPAQLWLKSTKMLPKGSPERKIYTQHTRVVEKGKQLKTRWINSAFRLELLPAPFWPEFPPKRRSVSVFNFIIYAKTPMCGGGVCMCVCLHVCLPVWALINL